MALEAHVAPAVALRLLVIEAGKRNVPCQSLLFLSAGRPRSDLCSGEMNDEWEKPRLQGQGSERRLCGEDAALTRAPVLIRFRGERNCTITFSYLVLLGCLQRYAVQNVFRRRQESNAQARGSGSRTASTDKSGLTRRLS